MRSESLDILGLSEVDLADRTHVLEMQGYAKIVNTGPKIRLLTYIRQSISVQQLSYYGDIPTVVFNTPQMTIGFVYSEFTSSKNRLTETERLHRLEGFLLWFSSVAKKRAIVLGDMNVNLQVQKKKNLRGGLKRMDLLSM